MARRLLFLFSLVFLTGCTATVHTYPSQIRLAVYTPICLDVLDASTTDGASVQIYSCGDGKLSQEWQLTSVTNNGTDTGQLQIMNENSKMCMAVSSDASTGGVNAPGQKVVQETCATDYSEPSQLWKLVPATDGIPGNQLVSVASGQCLDLPYGAIASIFLMQQYTCTPGDPAQGWNINPVQLGNTP